MHAVVSLVVATVAGVAFDVNEGDTTFATSVFCTKGFVAQGRDAFVSLGLPDATRNHTEAGWKPGLHNYT